MFRLFAYVIWLVQGLDVGRCELVLHVRPCEGLMRQLDGTIEKRFAKKEILYPLQVLLLGYLIAMIHGDQVRKMSVRRQNAQQPLFQETAQVDVLQQQSVARPC